MNYKRIYDSIIERAKERVPEGYVERHHIVPRCLGGSDEKENLVALTPEEHFLCHVLLVKIYPDHGGLIYAVNMMCSGNKCHNHLRKRKLYGWLKRKFSAQRKIDGAGKNNTQHGTMWINKTGTTENKKIPVGEQVPEGWVKGRRIKLVQTKKSKKKVAKIKTVICDKECKVCGTLSKKEFCCRKCQGIGFSRQKTNEFIQYLVEFINSDFDTVSSFAEHKGVTNGAFSQRIHRFLPTFKRKTNDVKSDLVKFIKERYGDVAQLADALALEVKC